MTDETNYKGDLATELAWASRVKDEKPMSLTARDVELLISTIYRMSSAVFRSNSSIFALASANPEAAIAEAKTSVNETNIALGNLNALYKEIKERAYGDSNVSS